VILAICRMRYPFELEWTEGGFVDQLQRIVNGQPVYVAPSVNFVPFLYTPLYFYVSAAVAKLVGVGFLPLRLVSFVASLGAFAMIFLIVRRETGSRFLALTMAGLFAATYRATGAWFDIARVDSLFLFWFLTFVYFVRARPSRLSYLLAGVAMGLAFLTKQSALLACAPVLLFCALRNLRYTLFLLVGSAFLLVAAVTVALSISSHGWYTYYVFDLLSNQADWIGKVMLSFWQQDLLNNLAIAILAACYYLSTSLRRARTDFYAWFLIALGALAVSFLSRIKQGGYENVLMPIYAVLVILLGLGAHQLLEVIHAQGESLRKPGLVSVYVAMTLQFLLFAYQPGLQLPREGDSQAGQRLLSLIGRVPGPVYVPGHGYLTKMAGKESFAHYSAIWDVMRGSQAKEGRAMLRNSISQAIAKQSFGAILLDGDWRYLDDVEQYYQKAGSVFSSQEHEAFLPVTGMRTRPVEIWLPKQTR
jgi:hypothetical protein